MDQGSELELKKGQKTWLWVVLIIIVLIAAGLATYYFSRNKGDTSDDKSNSSQSASSKSTLKETTTETWQKSETMVFARTTSTDTHKISAGLFRMYMNAQGGISYSESTDGKTFNTPQPTGVKEDAGKIISNPAVLKISEGNWLMIYEQSPQQQPGQKQGKNLPGPSTQRNLYLATSTDGKTFTEAGVVIDSSKEDNYFASVPDLVLLPDGKVRMYYVSGGDAIGSAISSDAGKTWTREAGYRLKDMAVDPDVLYKDGKWVMYYTDLDPAKNAIYKASSSDGLTWRPLGKILDKAGAESTVVDADVIEITPGRWTMFFGAMNNANPATGQDINLYSASFSGNIY